MSGTSNEISSPMPSSSQSSSDNNNHEYVNITEEMISHLREVSNSRPHLQDGSASADRGNYLTMGGVNPERKSDEELEACNYVVFDSPLHPTAAAQSPKQTQEHHSYMQMNSPSFEYVPMVTLTLGCLHHSKERSVEVGQRPRQPTPEDSPASTHNTPQTQSSLSEDTNFYMDGASSCRKPNCTCVKTRSQNIPSNSSPALTDPAASQVQRVELHSPDVMSSSINSSRVISSNEHLSQQDSACDTYYESIRDSSSSATSRGSCSTNSSNLTALSLDSGGDYHHASSDAKETDTFLPEQQEALASVHTVMKNRAPLLEDGALSNQRRFPFSMSTESGFSSEETAV
jgi:hypothetical protein